MATPAAYLNIVLDPDTRKAKRELRGFERDMKRTNRQLEATAGGMGGMNKEIRKGQAEFDGLNVEAGKFNRNMLSMRNAINLVKWPALLSGVKAATQGVMALAAGASALIGALTPLAGLVAAAPALYGAMGQAAGVVALSGVKDLASAVGGLNEKMDRQAEAFKSLSPQAQKFAGRLDELKAPIRRLQRDVQRPLFEGMTQGLDAARKNLPALRSVLAGTAEEMGNLARRAGEFAGRKGFGRDLEKIGRTNAELLGRMGRAGLNLGDALRHVMIAARPLVDWLGRMGLRMSEWIKDAARAGRESGDLRDFFMETKDLLKVLGPLLADFGMGLWNVVRIGKPLGDDILGVLADSAREFRKWTESAKGENAIVQWYKDSRPVLSELGLLVKDLGTAFFDLGKGDQPIVDVIKTLRKDLLPVIVEIVEGSASFLPTMLEFARQAIPAIQPFIGPTGPLTLMVKGATELLRLFNRLIEAVPELGTVLAGLVTLKGFGVLGGLMGMGGKGKGIGGLLGGGIAAGAAGGVAGGATGGGLASKVGGVLKNIRWARVGGIGAGVALAGTLLEGFETAAKLKSKNVMERVSGHLGTIPKGPSDFDIEGGPGGSLLDALFPPDDTHRMEADITAMVAHVDRLNKAGLSLDAKKFKEYSRVIDGLAVDDEFKNDLREMLNVAGGPMALKLQKDSRFIERAFKRGFGLKETRAQFVKELRVIRANYGRHSAETSQLTGVAKQAVLRHVSDLVKRQKVSLGEAGRFLKKFGLDVGDLGSEFRPMSSKAIDAFHDVNRGTKELKDKSSRHFGELSRNAHSALHRTAEDGRRESGRMRKGVVANVDAMVDTVGSGLGRLGRNTNKALKAFGVKPVNFAIVDGKKTGTTGLQRGGIAAAKGMIVPGQMPGDRHVLSLNNQPIAKVESGEKIAVVNREAAKAEMALNRSVPRMQGGGMFVDPAGPGTGVVNKAIAGVVGAWSKRYDAAINYGFDPGGGHVSPGHNVTGTATDTGPAAGWGAGPTRLFETGLKAILGKVDQILYGSHGVGTAYPNHGWGNHAHIEWGMHPEIQGAMMDQLRRVLLKGPEGPLTTMGQASLDKAHKAMQKYLAKKGGAGGGGDFSAMGGPIADVAKQMVVSRWNQGQWPPFLELKVRESGPTWDPTITNPDSGAGGIPQGLPPSKMGSPAWPPTQGRVSAIAQLDWMINDYIPERYGTPSAALAFHDVNNAYLRGGIVGMKNGGIFAGGPVVPGGPALGPGGGGGGGGNGGGGNGGGGILSGFDDVLAKIGLGGDGGRKTLQTLLERIRAIKPDRFVGPDGLAGDLLKMREAATRFLDYSGRAGSRDQEIPFSLEKAAGKWRILGGNDEELQSFATEGEAVAAFQAMVGPLLGVFRGKNERQWREKELAELWTLRNKMLQAHDKIVRRRDQLANALKKANNKLKFWQHKLDDIEKALGKKGKTPGGWKGPDPAKGSVKTWNNQGDRKRRQAMLEFERKGGVLPGDRAFAEDGSLLTRESHPAKFPDPGPARRIISALDPKIIGAVTKGQGAFAEARGTVLGELVTAQGDVPEMGQVKDMPALADVLGVFGGEIFDAAQRLQELGAKPDIRDTSADLTEPTGMNIEDLLQFARAVKLGAFGQVPSFAKGGVHGGGWAMIGERGPELMNLGPGRIHSNAESQALFKPTIYADFRVGDETLAAKVEGTVRELESGEVGRWRAGRRF